MGKAEISLGRWVGCGKRFWAGCGKKRLWKKGCGGRFWAGCGKRLCAGCQVVENGFGQIVEKTLMIFRIGAFLSRSGYGDLIWSTM